eukprot:7388698-Prymnesium_polylepis.1
MRRFELARAAHGKCQKCCSCSPRRSSAQPDNCPCNSSSSDLVLPHNGPPRNGWASTLPRGHAWPIGQTRHCCSELKLIELDMVPAGHGIAIGVARGHCKEWGGAWAQGVKITIEAQPPI